MSLASKKIVWTVDPFAKNKELQESAAWAIKCLSQDIQITVEPVYFFSAYLTSDSPLKIPLNWIDEIQKSGQIELDKIISAVQLEGIKPLHVIAEPYLSMREGVERISQIARRWGSDMIVTSTHARRGIKRWFIGSFSETLLLHSDIPQLFINPNWDRMVSFKSLFFPTDFSPESHDAFEQLIQIAKSLGSKIHLFHKFIYSWPPVLSLSTEAYPLYSNMFDYEIENRRKDALTWSQEAESQGVEVTAEIETQHEESVSQSILRQVSKDPGLIAMASKSGPAKTLLLGSTTRNIVRDSPYPVWVLHPRLKAQEKPQKKSA